MTSLLGGHIFQCLDQSIDRALELAVPIRHRVELHSGFSSIIRRCDEGLEHRLFFKACQELCLLVRCVPIQPACASLFHLTCQMQRD
jgi:hypothetical protein